jgi:hypothetical protein
MKQAWPLVIGAIWAALPVQADSLTTDAFGVFERAAGPRDGWAGLVETLDLRAVSGKLRPAGPGRDVILNLGEKSLIAGGNSELVAALVLDAQGNLAADGTEVTFVTGPDTAVRPTRFGIASTLFSPGVKAGQFHAGAGIEGHQSGLVDYVVNADAASVTLRLVDGPETPALAEAFKDLLTLPLKDRFGNPVEDGSVVGLRLIHGDGTVTLIDGVVVGGIGRARFLARDTDTDAVATAQFANAVSDAVPFNVTPLEPMGTAGIRAEYLADIDATRLILGPFLTTAGHALNDGATIEIDVTTARGGKVQAGGWLLDGMLETILLVGKSDYPVNVVINSQLGQVEQPFASPMTVDGP